MKKTTLTNASQSFMFFMMSLCLGFLGLIMPWSSAYFRTLSVGASMYNKMGHPLSFWQSSFFGLIFRQAPCRSWIITQVNTPQGNILNLAQAAGFLVLFVLVSLWLIFVWSNRKALTESQKNFLLKTSLFLSIIGVLIIVRMATFADCSLIQSIELLDIQFFWTALFFSTFAVFYGLLAIAKSRQVSQEDESV